MKNNNGSKNKERMPFGVESSGQISPFQNPRELADYLKTHQKYMKEHEQAMAACGVGAVWANDQETLTTLRNNNVDFTKPDAAGVSPVMMAAWSLEDEDCPHAADTLRNFAAQGIDIQPHVDKAMNAHLKVMAEPDSQKTGQDAVSRTAAVQKMLTEFSADPHTVEPQTLIGLARNGHGEILDLLEKHGVDVNSVKDANGASLSTILKESERPQNMQAPSAPLEYTARARFEP